MLCQAKQDESSVTPWIADSCCWANRHFDNLLLPPSQRQQTANAVGTKSPKNPVGVGLCMTLRWGQQHEAAAAAPVTYTPTSPQNLPG
jgi:hypothetical protein